MPTETVTLRLPSGEEVDAIIPAGLDDAGVKALVRMKQPDLFGPPAGIKPPANPIVTQELKNPRSPNYDAPLPGSAEGANLAEGLGNWVDQGPVNIGRGVVHGVQGKIAKGGHEILSGVGTSMLPALPFGAAVAPVGTALSIAGANIGREIGKPTAEALGATPDQADLAGDIAGFAGGYGGAKIPGFAVTPVGKAMGGAAIEAGKAAVTKIPYVGPVLEAGYKGYQQGKLPPPAPPPVYSEARYPQAPPVEVSQARVLTEGGKAPPEPAAGLGKIPVAAPPPGAPPPVQVGKVGELLNKGLGGKPLIPNVPLRNQVRPVETPAGHTAAESSAVQSFKYDAAAKELHVTANNGVTYVSGEVTPEQFDAFQSAPSKGTAWKEIRDSSPLVRKISGGKEISVKPSSFRSVDPNAKVSTPNDDMVPILKKSLEQVRKKKR